NPYAVKFIKKQQEKHCWALLKYDPEYWHCLTKLSMQMCIYIVKHFNEKNEEVLSKIYFSGKCQRVSDLFQENPVLNWLVPADHSHSRAQAQDSVDFLMNKYGGKDKLKSIKIEDQVLLMYSNSYLMEY